LRWRVPMTRKLLNLPILAKGGRERAPPSAR